MLALMIASLFSAKSMGENKENAAVLSRVRGAELILYTDISKDVLVDMSAKTTLQYSCRNGELSKECRELAKASDNKRDKEFAVQRSIHQLSKEPDEFTRDKIRKFKNEESLLLAINSQEKSPIVVFKHEVAPIYFIKFGSSDLQDATLTRIGIFVEEGGGMARGSFPTSQKIDGHDYRVSDLASFFNLAEAQKVHLNAMEERLRLALLKSGLLQKTRDEGSKKYTYIASQTAAVLSIGSAKDQATVSHELNHAIFFTDLGYRNRIAKLYKEGLTDSEKKTVDQIMAKFADSAKFDFKSDHELFLTEFAAFFRDPADLWKSYLKPWGIPEAEEREIQSIAKKVKAQEAGAFFKQSSTLRPSSYINHTVR